MTCEGQGAKWRWKLLDSSSLEPEAIIRTISWLDLQNGVELIRENMVRRILRVRIHQAPPMVVKHYLPRGIGRSILQSIRSPQWEREFSAALGLLRLGIPAPRPLLVGERRRLLVPAEGILATEEIVGGLTLKEFLEKEGLIPRGLLLRLAGLLAEVHNRNVLHLDLHWDNIMLQEREKKLWLLDLHRVKMGFRLSKRSRIWNLAQLFRSLEPYLGHELRREFIREYLRLASIADVAEEWEGEITRVQLEMTRRHEISRTKRCLEESSHFHKYTWKGFHIIRRRDLPHGILVNVLESSDSHREATLKFDAKVRVRAETHGTGDGQIHLCVKQFLPRASWKDVFLFRSRKRAERFWVGAWGLRVRGLPAPQCYAMWRPKLLSKRATSGVVMEMLSGCSLKDYVAEIGKERDAVGKLSSRLALLLARMHEKGVFHRDMKASNLLVKEEGGVPEVFLMDLEDVRFRKRVSAHMVMRNLNQLNGSVPSWIPKSVKLRFLATYLGARSRGKELEELVGLLKIGKKVLK